MLLRRDIFQAVADPTRRSILVLLAAQTLTAGEIADRFESARSTVSKHIQILTTCGLVEANQQGREIHYQIKMDKVKEIDSWLDQLRMSWEARFDSLDKYVQKLKNDKNHGKNRKP